MGNKLSKITIFLSFCLFAFQGFATKYPGFHGKKFAIGYGLNYSVLESGALLGERENVFRKLMNHDMYVEYGIRKYTSVSAHFSFQKIPFGTESSGTFFDEQYSLNGQPYSVTFRKTGGSTDFVVRNFGLKFSFFKSAKTIASPIGYSQYLKVAMLSAQVKENGYTYVITDNGLSTAQRANAIIPQPNETKVNNLCFGYGIESKSMITNQLFIRVNGEINVSTSFLADEKYGTISINDDLREIGNNLSGLRNLVFVGVGVGLLVF